MECDDAPGVCHLLGRRHETCVEDPAPAVSVQAEPTKPKRSRPNVPGSRGSRRHSPHLLAATLIVSPNSSGRGDFARGLYGENDFSFRRRSSAFQHHVGVSRIG